MKEEQKKCPLVQCRKLELGLHSSWEFLLPGPERDQGGSHTERKRIKDLKPYQNLRIKNKSDAQKDPRFEPFCHFPQILVLQIMPMVSSWNIQQRYNNLKIPQFTGDSSVQSSVKPCQESCTCGPCCHHRRWPQAPHEHQWHPCIKLWKAFC